MLPEWGGFRSSPTDLLRLCQNGKNFAEAKGEVQMSIAQLDWMSGEAQRGYGDFIPSALPGVRNVVLKQAIGVAGIVRPSCPESSIQFAENVSRQITPWKWVRKEVSLRCSHKTDDFATVSHFP